MSSYIPGAGLKKPLAQLENPVYPFIQKAGPRFVWSRKHWVVDPGQVQKSVEHIPQMQENAVLFQSRDYNKQHAYGRYPKYNNGTFVNKEFRPPMQDRDDFLPLSRIPRPVVLPRINPGGAFSSGGSVFSQQNMGVPQVEKFISDRVKAGEMRPTFFAPIEMPQDNSILPDLELKMPSVSAGAGFTFPAASNRNLEQDNGNYMQLDYNRAPVTTFAGFNTPYKVTAPDGRSTMEFTYNKPQVSAGAGYQNDGMLSALTPVDMELGYNRPQVSVKAIESFTAIPGLTPVDMDFEYNKPQVSAGAGFSFSPVYGDSNGLTSVDHLLKGNDDRIDVSSIGGNAGNAMSPIYNMEDREIAGKYAADRATTTKHNISYTVPSNTYYQKPNSIDGSSEGPFYRQKQNSISGQHGNFSTQGHVKRAGIDMPQMKKLTSKIHI